MKKSKLRKIIQEEIQKVLNENDSESDEAYKYDEAVEKGINAYLDSLGVEHDEGYEIEGDFGDTNYMTTTFENPSLDVNNLLQALRDLQDDGILDSFNYSDNMGQHELELWIEPQYIPNVFDVLKIYHIGEEDFDLDPTKNCGSFTNEDSVNEDLPTKEIDPTEYPDPIPSKERGGFPIKGQKDGEKEDDIVPTQPIKLPAKALKPSQDAVYLGKALSQAIAGAVGGNIGAVISNDNHILDGHHRWAATIFDNPKNSVGGMQADLAIGDLIPVLRGLGDAFGNQRGSAGSSQGISIWDATPQDLINVLRQLNKGNKYIEPGKAQEWVEKVGGLKVVADRLKLIQSYQIPAGAPSRDKMPRIEPEQINLVKKLLNKGYVDVREPYANDATRQNQHTAPLAIGNRNESKKGFDVMMNIISEGIRKARDKK